jgi:hypothetical protein
MSMDDVKFGTVPLNWKEALSGLRLGFKPRLSRSFLLSAQAKALFSKKAILLVEFGMKFTKAYDS